MNRSVLNHANAAGLAMPRAAPAQTQTGNKVVSVSVMFSSVERWPGTERSPEAAVETAGLWFGEDAGRKEGKRERKRSKVSKEEGEKDRGERGKRRSRIDQKSFSGSIRLCFVPFSPFTMSIKSSGPVDHVETLLLEGERGGEKRENGEQKRRAHKTRGTKKTKPVQSTVSIASHFLFLISSFASLFLAIPTSKPPPLPPQTQENTPMTHREATVRGFRRDAPRPLGAITAEATAAGDDAREAKAALAARGLAAAATRRLDDEAAEAKQRALTRREGCMGLIGRGWEKRKRKGRKAA